MSNDQRPLNSRQAFRLDFENPVTERICQFTENVPVSQNQKRICFYSVHYSNDRPYLGRIETYVAVDSLFDRWQLNIDVQRRIGQYERP